MTEAQLRAINARLMTLMRENNQLRAHLAQHRLSLVERACVNLARRDLGLTVGPDVKAWAAYAHKLGAAVSSLLAIIDKLAPALADLDAPGKEKP